MKQKVAFLGILLAFAIILGYVESILPFTFWMPGMKLGLPNLAILLAFYLYGKKEAFIINVLRIVICAFIFTNMYSMLYSLAGAVLSFTVMSLLFNRKWIGPVGVSIAGATAHNIGQMLIAVLITRVLAVTLYLPLLLLCALVTGSIIGLFGQLILPRLKKFTL